MRPPNFMQGVVPRPSQPARFGSLSSDPKESPPVAPPSSAPAPAPSPPVVGMPVALAELRPPPSPPRPPAAPSAELQHALQTLRLQTERLAELARSDALEIGFMVAERILEAEISQNPRALISLVRSAMRRLGESRHITVSLCPSDHERLSTQPPADATLAVVKFQVDPALQPGDCIVNSELGVVDGKLSTRLSELKRSIEDEGED